MSDTTIDFSTDAILQRMRDGLENPANKLEGGFCMDNLQAVAEEMARMDAMEVQLIPDHVLLDKKGVGAGCSGSANYYKQKGQFHTSGPQPGDQIFFTNDGGKTMYHTGIVEKVAGGRVYTIEGNTSSAAGVVENGGCVRDKSYALTYSKIGGYGRPDFSIVPEEDDDMDQNKFNEMFKVAMTAHQKELQDNDCGEWSREAREWAIRVGLFAGNGTTADGQPNYMWASPLTREQAAQLFYRFAQDHGLA